MKKLRPVLVLLVLLALAWSWRGADPSSPGLPEAGSVTGPASGAALPGFLPPEAAATLALIARRGPYPHRQDGGVFQNRERRLPERPRGHYREYTVPTPGLGHRGPRRIVTGGDPPSEYWYTDDHYASFRRFEVAR
jgi:guanyl-specific ribonuclease Sa